MVHGTSRRTFMASAAAILCLPRGAAAAAKGAESLPVVRIGTLKFGTVSWELETIRAAGLDREAGIQLEIVDFAGNQATQIALQAGAVDMIVSDFVWVARRRAVGEDLSFLPYSTAVGALMVPPGSPVAAIPDLQGRRIGVAGSRIDKSWLLLLALARQRHGLDLERAAEVVYGGPPLLNQQVETGRLDAVLNYWHFAARLEARGMRRLVGVDEIMRALGIEAEIPAVGYVFRESWAGRDEAAIKGFAAASRAAKDLMLSSDAAWERLRPLMQAEDEATFLRLRERYREGIPRRWGSEERAGAARLFAILAEFGGSDLAGDVTSLDPGTFWPGVAF
ncbi:ABC transporter substrate-binding protein [Arenibaculum pallidiluteum]|uniref:ABC transporter substrate-binding protein n=1 Tax=Arenibaculum pallidiluteum TaxID=2812559 RepID=UPI001A975A55|nr:ABC transporter substrate-binding protein [Arenibaculum pallidiluteum]